MTDLKDLLGKSDFNNITTYIQSGNLVFTAEKSNQVDLAHEIEKLILDRYGFEVPVIVINQIELSTIIEHNPFVAGGKADSDKLHVTFLAKQPVQVLIDSILNFQDPPNEFIIEDRSIYLHCPSGYGRVKITNSFFEKKLKVSATTRNWKTIFTLSEICNEMKL